MPFRSSPLTGPDWLRGTCAFIDAEHALDVASAQKLGVDAGSLLVAQPDPGEQAPAAARWRSTSAAASAPTPT